MKAISQIHANRFKSTICFVSLIFLFFLAPPCGLRAQQDVDSLKKMISSYQDKCNYYEVVRYIQKLIPLLEEQGDSFNRAVYFSALGEAKRNLGQLTDAMECYNASNRILENTGQENINRLKIENLLNIAIIYCHNKNFEMAEKINRECINLVEEQKFSMEKMHMLARCYHGLSVIYCDCSQKLNGNEKKQKLEASVEWGLKAYQLSIEYNDTPLNIARRTTIVGQVYAAGKEYGKAKHYFDEALNLAKEYNYYYISAKIFEELAIIESTTGNDSNTQYYFEQSINFAKESKNDLSLLQVLKTAYETYREKNAVKALDYYEKYISLKDTIFDMNQKQLISEFQVKYETAEKELEISRQALVISRQNIRHIIFVVVLGLTAVILILLWCTLHYRTKRNRILAKMNATKDKLFSIISHEMKNPAIAQRDALQMLLDRAGEWDATSLTQIHSELLKSAGNQVELLHNLLNWARMQTGGISYVPVTFDMVAEVRPDILLIQNQAERKGITFEVDVSPEAIVTGDCNMLVTVVRNLLTNAVKFTGKGGRMTFKVEKNGCNYTVTVSNTGSGMSSEQLRNLFCMESQHSKTGTAGERGSGLGLIVCKEFLEKHGSILHVENEEGKGSKFWFTIISS
jgi:signal transduction histidine kinase